MVTEPESNAAPRTLRARVKDWLRYKRFQFHLRYPRIFRHPTERDDLVRARRRDATENERTTPPPAERVTPIAMWFVELYGPSEVATLIESLDRWEAANRRRATPDQSAADWIRKTRRHGHRGWHRLGLFASKTTFAFGDTVRCTPPEGIAYIAATLHSVTSSLCCIVFQFVLAKSEYGALDELLRREYQTAVSTKNRVRWRTPVGQVKLRAVEAWEDDYRKRCQAWIADEAPGIFTRATPTTELPCCHLVQLAQLLPFSNPKDSARGYARLLGVESDFGAYIADDLPGFRLGEPAFGRRSGPLFKLAFRPQDIPTEALRTFGGEGPRQYLNFLDDRVEGVFIGWALLRLVDAYQGALNHSRDLFPTLRLSRRGASRLLGYITDTLSITGSLSGIRSDLETFTASSWWSDEIPCFVSLHDPKIRLSEELRTRLQRDLAGISKDEHNLQNHLSQYASVFSASASLRMQSQVRLLTWIILVLTLASVVLGVIVIRGPSGTRSGPASVPPAVQQGQP